MPQARDEAGNVWEVDAQGNPVRLVQPAPSQGRIIPNAPNPTAQYEVPKAQADIGKTAAQTREIEATLPSVVRKTQADATKAEVEAASIVQDQRLYDDAQERRRVRGIFKTDTILSAIRNARRIVQEDGGVGLSSLFSPVPSTAARRLESELAPIKGNLAFDNLSQMREESKTGAAVGNVTERELDLLASTVASLDQGVDAQTFLRRLDAIESHFINAQVAALGVDPYTPEAREIMKRDYGFAGVAPGEEPADTASLGRADATETRDKLPPEYQAEHLRYLRENWGQMTPESYVKFRTGLDEAYGFTPDIGAYAQAVPNFNAAAQEGAIPEQLGAVPNPARQMSAIEQGINTAAQSAPGAAFANATNALAAGLPARLGGQQDNLNLLREARPVSSFLGEMVGGGVGAAMTGGALAAAGRGSMAASPYIAEALHGSVMGATQDDNALRGAATGALGALGGSFIGQRIGKEFPQTFARGQVQAADESVPTIDQFKELAGEQYRDVQATGATAQAADTQGLYDRARAILSREAKITPKGNLTQVDGKTSEAMKLLGDYAGEEMGPVQAQAVRSALSEGLGSMDKSEQRIANLLLRNFDEWADPVLPGIEVPRATSQRYLQGQQIQQRGNIAKMRGQRMKGNDEGDATRTQFGQLDEAIEKGRAYFDPATTGHIAKAARGDALTNALRSAGKYGLGNPLTAGGIGVGGVGASLGFADPLYAGAALTAGALGTGARRLAESRTARAAQEAELSALGGQEWADLMESAKKMAARRAGGLFGGGGAVAASNTNR